MMVMLTPASNLDILIDPSAESTRENQQSQKDLSHSGQNARHNYCYANGDNQWSDTGIGQVNNQFVFAIATFLGSLDGFFFLAGRCIRWM